MASLWAAAIAYLLPPGPLPGRILLPAIAPGPAPSSDLYRASAVSTLTALYVEELLIQALAGGFGNPCDSIWGGENDKDNQFKILM